MSGSDCAAGTYSTAVGATGPHVCEDCPAGTWSSAKGRAEPCYELCAPGQYCEAGANGFTGCPAGWTMIQGECFSPSVSGTTNDCSAPAGYVSDCDYIESLCAAEGASM